MKHIMTRACAWILAALLVAPLLQSCKSDEEDFIKDFPSECTLKLGESCLIVDIAEDALVVPAVMANFKWQSDDENVAIVKNASIQGVGIGETEIRIYNSDASEVLAVVQVKVLPTASVTMKAGETRLITDILSKEIVDDLGRNIVSSSSDIKVADTYHKYWDTSLVISAESPGKAYIKFVSYYNVNLKYVVEVIVEKSTDEVYFPMPCLEFGALLKNVKEQMSDYQLEYEGDERLGSYSYRALRYKPFGASSSVTYYFEKRPNFGNQAIYALQTVVIDTGRESEDAFRYMMSNYNHNIRYPWPASMYFNLPDSRWKITSVDNEWNKIRFLYGY